MLKTFSRQGIEGVLDKRKRAEPLLDPARNFIDFLLGNNPDCLLIHIHFPPVSSPASSASDTNFITWVPTLLQREEENNGKIRESSRKIWKQQSPLVMSKRAN